MNRQYVSSSDIQSVGYQNGTLEVAFHSGGIYQYLNVPESVYKNFMSASSHGQYFHSHIKDVYHPIKIA